MHRAQVYLNESPSEKEGKLQEIHAPGPLPHTSMKVPPKRKGNGACRLAPAGSCSHLNESPSEKEGKSVDPHLIARVERTSMKVPPKRKGNLGPGCGTNQCQARTSMKVPPKRKGN